MPLWDTYRDAVDVSSHLDGVLSHDEPERVSAVVSSNPPASSARRELSGVGVESARGYAANDTLNVACIGTGGRTAP
ncbi:MAG: hypothetical protein U0835_14180 [Isosphaeraceae bacterium]